ncbi:hypothetical protein B0T21DRAFT_77151 [Apiosordaria backusii]|uniref:Uncharacterized protein n=1 Tax=Apiosordaria backusii TaxID=314023 RepID=A0AA40DR49_9PEZI|nr:hypothetical protein B0T21DRAFT_77151 [Apiosordaria backusii]
MHLLELPVEIRLLIFSEVIVSDWPIEFRRSPNCPGIFRVIRDYRPPRQQALLYVNKVVHEDAKSILYSNTHFEFPDTIDHAGYRYVTPGKLAHWHTRPHVQPFLDQIGRNSHLLRHICINLPDCLLAPRGGENPLLCSELVQALQLIRDSCSNLITFKISSWRPRHTRFILLSADHDLFVAQLEAMDACAFGAMPSLERVALAFWTYGIDEALTTSRDRLAQRMPSAKWSIEVLQDNEDSKALRGQRHVSIDIDI